LRTIHKPGLFRAVSGLTASLPGPFPDQAPSPTLSPEPGGAAQPRVHSPTWALCCASPPRAWPPGPWLGSVGSEGPPLPGAARNLCSHRQGPTEHARCLDGGTEPRPPGFESAVSRRTGETEARVPEAEKRQPSLHPSKEPPPSQGSSPGAAAQGAHASLPTHRAALGKSYLPVPRSFPVLTRSPLPSLALASGAGPACIPSPLTLPSGTA